MICSEWPLSNPPSGSTTVEKKEKRIKREKLFIINVCLLLGQFLMKKSKNYFKKKMRFYKISYALQILFHSPSTVSITYQSA